MRTVRPPKVTAALVLLALVAVACSHAEPADDADTEVGADTDVDPDTDGVGDTDVLTDTDTVVDSDDPTPDCSLGCATGTSDVDANPLTGACGCEYACTPVSGTDPYDAAFTDENCDGGDGVVDACVYVSASVGSDAGAGTRTDPRHTLGGALQLAAANAVPFVCVSGEVYTEAFTVPEGVTLVGSFDHLDPDFAFRRKAGVTTTVNGDKLP